MFSENELRTEYGRECRERQFFWASIGVPKKQRTKFAAYLGCSSATELWRETKDDDNFDLLIECYKDYKEAKGMSSLNMEWVKKAPCPPTVSWYNQSDCFATFTAVTPYMTGCKTVSKEEEKMDTTYEQRRYLEQRLDRVSQDHKAALRTQFHMDYQGPKSLNEAAELIKSGKATVNQKALEKMNRSWSADEDAEYPFDQYVFFSVINWGTPEPDTDGYKAAEKLLGKAYTDAKDIIKVSAPEEGLKALKEFEAKTFH